MDSNTEMQNNGINSSTLKIYALVMMLFDHISGVVLDSYLKVVTDYDTFLMVKNISSVFRGIGRIAFPIFCYQLVVGTRYTKNIKKYIFNLFLFSLISEIPFNLAFCNSLFGPTMQSVYITLLLGAVMIFVLNHIKEGPFSLYIKLCIVFIFCMMGFYLKTDYGFAGVALIAAFYFFIDDRDKMVICVPIIFITTYFIIKYIKIGDINQTIKITESESLSILSMLLIMQDNGIRKGGKVLKWVGYSFYPVHLLILYFIRTLIM